MTFDYTGAAQTWTVPEDVTSVSVDAYGAKGGELDNGSSGGKGGQVKTNLTVTPEETLYIYVGQWVGSDTYDSRSFGGGGSGPTSSGRWGSAGGGATHISIREGALNTYGDSNHVNYNTQNDNILVVAGGGCAGALGGGMDGGDGGGLKAERGANTEVWWNEHYERGRGEGGSQNSGGAGGEDYSSSGYTDLLEAQGSLGYGGNGIMKDGAGGGGGYYGGGARMVLEVVVEVVIPIQLLRPPLK